MRSILAVSAVLALGATACTDLATLGTCGNGIVEPNRGEDCDDPADPDCSACRLVCDQDLPADGVCPDLVRCCLAGQRCGLDSICRTPSGLFASPAGVFEFPVTQHEVVDVDGDGIGDVLGLDRVEAHVLFGALGSTPSRGFAAPIPPASRPDSHFGFLANAVRANAPVVASSGSGVAVPTERGFAVLLAAQSGLVSPPLPEIALDVTHPSGGGPVPDTVLAVAPAVDGILVGAIAEARADDPAPEVDRVALWAFAGRTPVGSDQTPCGLTLTDAALASATAIVRTAAGPGGDPMVFAAVASEVDGPALCAYRGTTLGAPAMYPVPDRIAQMFPARLDAEPCPELVVQTFAGQVGYVDPGGADCTAVAGATYFAAGALLGVGDLDGDGRDEVVVGQEAWTAVLGVAHPVPGLRLLSGQSAAVIADLNRDGAADLATTSADARDLTVYLATAAGFAPRTVGTSGTLSELVAADFDADTFTDLATIERESSGVTRVLVAFGGITGPQAATSIGEMTEPRSLATYIDPLPAEDADAFADLVLLHLDGTFASQVAQFNGAATRALFSEFDTGAVDPFVVSGRTAVAGELYPPRDDGSDFCTLNVGLGGTGATLVTGFCVGGQGNVVGGGAVDDAGAFTTGPTMDAIEPGELLPLWAVVDVGTAPTGVPYNALVGVRRDRPEVAPQLVVSAPPPPLAGPPPPAITSAALDIFHLRTPGPEATLLAFPFEIAAVELDGDPDTELVVSFVELESGSAPEPVVHAEAFRVDLSATGATVTATATRVVDDPSLDCLGAARVELGDVLPGGGAAAPGPELVTLCASTGTLATQPSAALYAIYRTADGAWAPPVPVGSSLGIAGLLASGDLDGDHLDDLAIVTGDDRAVLAIMKQCSRQDPTACATSASGGTKE